ncbi:MAG: hypothetical protein NTW78_02855 [Campylobacterales bacterium]|nr:hypothetical protein [Campylobacterales bacterium]
MIDLTQFLQLFHPYPGNRYLQVTTQADETTTALHKILKGVNGELSLAIYSEQNFSLQFPDTKIQNIQNFQDPFRAIPREFDMVMFKDIFCLHENKKMILKIAYTTLANTAHIIIIEKKGIMDIEATKCMLEDFEFRASNAIDVLEGYDLIMAKKMHMWGAGL